MKNIEKWWKMIKMEKYGNIVQGSHHIPSPPWPQPSPAFWPRPTFEWRQPLPSTAVLDTLSHRGPQLRPDPFVKEQSLGGGPATDLSFKIIKVVLGTTHSDSMWFNVVQVGQHWYCTSQVNSLCDLVRLYCSIWWPPQQIVQFPAARIFPYLSIMTLSQLPCGFQPVFQAIQVEMLMCFSIRSGIEKLWKVDGNATTAITRGDLNIRS